MAYSFRSGTALLTCHEIVDETERNWSVFRIQPAVSEEGSLILCVDSRACSSRVEPGVSLANQRASSRRQYEYRPVADQRAPLGTQQLVFGGRRTAH